MSDTNQTTSSFTLGQKVYVAGESVHVLECYFSAHGGTYIGLCNHAADCGDPYKMHDVLAKPDHVFTNKIDAYRAHAAILREEAATLEDIVQMVARRAASAA
jgi:hypothetical protein